MFQPEVEVTIKLLLVAAVTGAFVVTFAWGYEGRQQARRWREIACTHRVTDLARTAPGIADGRTACDTLQRIGMTIVR